MEGNVGFLRKRRERDWVGLWYKIAREDRGVNDLFTFLKIDLVDGRVLEHVDISHERMDGLGALTWMLRREGNRIDRVPEGRVSPPPGFWGKLRLLLNFRKVARDMSVDWVGGDATKSASLREIAHIVLTREETRAIEARAKTERLSMNAVLMATLSNVLAPSLVRGDRPFLWLFPVNMRGPVRRENELANASSAVGIEAHKAVTPREVHAHIKEQLSNNIHWATWWTVNIGRVIGERGMRWLSSRRASNNFWMGTFSNLGAWPPPGLELPASNPRHAWVASPPGTVNFPIGCACVTWNGQLALTLKIHPSVCADFGRVRGYLDEVRRKLVEFGRPASGPRPERRDPEVQAHS